MKVSTEINSAAKIIGEEYAVELLAKSGFDAWDFSMQSMCIYDWRTQGIALNNHPLAENDYLGFARRLKQVGLDNGIVCNQSHAPAPTSCPEIRSFLRRAIECTAEAGGKICVIHPANDGTPQENAEMYLELLPFAKDCGVKIATENMYNWDAENRKAIFAACGTVESFCDHLSAVNDDDFVACLDIGHAEMMGIEGNAVRMVRGLGQKLQALHIHDNDLRFDSHQIPFSMKIEYEPILLALKEIGYNGYFTLESYNYLKAYTKENISTGITCLCSSIKRLAQQYEALN